MIIFVIIGANYCLLKIKLFRAIFIVRSFKKKKKILRAREWEGPFKRGQLFLRRSTLPT